MTYELKTDLTNFQFEASDQWLRKTWGCYAKNLRRRRVRVFPTFLFIIINIVFTIVSNVVTSSFIFIVINVLNWLFGLLSTKVFHEIGQILTFIIDRCWVLVTNWRVVWHGDVFFLLIVRKDARASKVLIGGFDTDQRVGAFKVKTRIGISTQKILFNFFNIFA